MAMNLLSPMTKKHLTSPYQKRALNSTGTRDADKMRTRRWHGYYWTSTTIVDSGVVSGIMLSLTKEDVMPQTVDRKTVRSWPCGRRFEDGIA